MDLVDRSTRGGAMQPEIEASRELMQYATTFLLLAAALVVVMALLLINSLIRPSKPGEEKELTYECGEKPVGSGWLRFNIRFYVIALVFVLFDVEMALVYPVACIFGPVTEAASGGFRAGLMVFGELFFFIGVLFLGLVYIWKKGDLGWVRSFRFPRHRGVRSWEQVSSAPIVPSKKR
jgi:NADH-quinone oxidoreductase subunit A